MSQWSLSPVGDYWLVAALLALLLSALVLLRLPFRQLTGRRRRVLFGLRVALLLLALVALLRPTLIHSETKKQSATLVLLVDRSRSMLVADALGDRTRWAALRSELENAQPALKDLAENLEIKVYSFDADLQTLPIADGTIDLDQVPDGQQSAIGAALEDVLRRESGKRIVGLILLSDGAQRAYAPRDVPPQTPARRLADLGCPLYTMTFGESRGTGQRDIAIRDLVVNQTVFVKNELTTFGTARIDGYVNQKIPVDLLFEMPSGKMQVVATQELELASGQDGQSMPLELSYVPQVPGEYKLTLRAAEQPGELVTTNNQMSTFVTVLKGGLNVLYLEGAYRVEQKFLRRSIDSSPDIKLDYLRLDFNPAKHPQDLIERFHRGKYDVYILGDVDSTAFTRPELAALAKVVHEGAGLIMLGGYHSFGPGGYGDTPLAEVLPVEMDKLERQRYGEAIRSDVHLAGPLKMRPARPLGTKHFVMSLGADNPAAWDHLPPLEGANKLVPKRTARVLADTPLRQPLLIAQEAGGRVMAFAGDSTWHWWMGDKNREYQAEHKRFWRQVVLWLAHKDDQAEDNVWLKLAQRRFAPGGRVEFTAGAVSAQRDPLKDATFQVEVLLPDGARQSPQLVQQEEGWFGIFTGTHTAGDYAIEVSAEHHGALIGKARARFLVYDQDLELDNPASDPTLMSSLAAMTKDAGGQALAPEELPSLLARLKKQPLEVEVDREVKESPWDTWPFFLLFVGILSTEWYLRKKWGLV